MTAGLYNFTIEQGTTFRRTFKWMADDEPVDLTGADCRMQIRKSKSLTSALRFDLTDYLTLNAEAGEVVLEIPGEETYDYSFSSGYYSLRVDRPGDDKRLIEGVVIISRETTSS